MKNPNLIFFRSRVLTEHTAALPGPVRELPPEVARKIAAGEVIDRPAAVVRELLDNSIDALSRKITVEITGGGIERIRISDDGYGMTREDLAVCTRTHTTSKISREEDLLSLSTLGFRGEALSSIQAVGQLEITSIRQGHGAWKLSNGILEPGRLQAGTIIQVENLFGNFPARRHFLKRPAAETGQCRQVFIEKALAWPDIEFRLTVDGQPKYILPAVNGLRERVIDALNPREGATLIHNITGTGEGFSFTAIAGSPDVVRPDRRDTQIFVNGRRIQEYSLVQAIEYGAEGHFPNGGHPFAFLFLTIDPSLVDFNIHPAKKEARFRDAGTIHHAVSSAIQSFYRNYTISKMRLETKNRELFEGKEHGFPSFDHANPASRARDMTSAGMSPSPFKNYREHSLTSGERSWPEMLVQAAHSKAPTGYMPPLDTGSGFRFLGQILGTFLAVEKGNRLYLVDQHAAHERILYDELMCHPGGRQELLVPYTIETDSERVDEHIEAGKADLEQAGFVLNRTGPGLWQVTSVPGRWKGTAHDIQEALSSGKTDGRALLHGLYALSACRAACKDGDILDPLTARNLVEKTFSLEEPVCPHGRPVWIVIDRDELFARIGRTE